MTLFTQLAVAQVILIPSKGAYSYSGSVHYLGCLEHRFEHGSLGQMVTNLAKRQAKGVRDKKRSRGFDQRGNLSYLGDRECAEPRLIKDTLEQSNGLLAHWSGRSEQHEIDVIFSKGLSDLYSRVLHQGLYVRDESHRGIHPRSERTDPANVDRGSQVLQWQDGVLVTTCMTRVVATVREHDLVKWGANRDLSIRWVARGHLKVEGCLVGKVSARCRDEANSSFGKWHP